MSKKLFKSLNISSINFSEFCLYFLFLTFLFSKFFFQINGIKVALWEIATVFLICNIFFKKKITFNKVNLYIILLLLIYLLSFVINHGSFKTIEIKEITLLIQMIRNLAIFFIIYNFYDQVNIKKIFKLIFYFTLIYLVFCFSLHFYFSETIGVQDKFDIIRKFGKKARLTAFGLGPNYLAWILIFSLFYSLFFNKKFYFFFLLFALYLTGSRTLMFILFFYLVFYLSIKINIKYIKYLSLIIFLTLFLIWDNNFYLYFKTPRWEIYTFVIQLISDSSFSEIFFGHGQRALYFNLLNSEDIFNKYSHNSYFDILYDVGLLFTSLFLVGIFFVGKIIIYNFKNSSNDSLVLISKTLSFFIITYLISMMFFSYFYLPIFWFFLAFFMLLNKNLKNESLHQEIKILKN